MKPLNNCYEKCEAFPTFCLFMKFNEGAYQKDFRKYRRRTHLVGSKKIWLTNIKREGNKNITNSNYKFKYK